MAGVPAYRYDHAVAEPYRKPATTPAPSVRVVPGRKHVSNPVLSDVAVLAIKVLISCLIALLVIGVIRVGLASAAYSTASQASDLRAQIADARTTGESLAVQESLLSSPTNIRAQAEEKLKMVPGVATEIMTLPVDPVAIDSAGHLSFAGSVSRITSQG